MSTTEAGCLASTRCLFSILLKLRGLDGLRLPTQSLRNIRTIVLGRMAREVEHYCPGHYGHGERTAGYALLLGRNVGLDENDLHALHLAALLHDIGLLTLSPAILSNPGMLNDHDYALFQSHPRAGAELLQSIEFLRSPSVLIAHHHERWDGCGYPYGLRGALLPLGARILAIADTFDSLTLRRFQDHAHDFGAALRLIQLLAGSQLDPDLVEIFIHTWTRRATRASCNRDGWAGTVTRNL